MLKPFFALPVERWSLHWCGHCEHKTGGLTDACHKCGSLANPALSGPCLVMVLSHEETMKEIQRLKQLEALELQNFKERVPALGEAHEPCQEKPRAPFRARKESGAEPHFV